MRRIIDLTYTIKAEMPVYPDDPEVRFVPTRSIKEGGYNLTEMIMGTHTGTHMDSPRHYIHTDQGIDMLPLEAMIGWAEVIDLGDLEPNKEITSADLDVFAPKIYEGARILLKTGWGRRYGDPTFYTDYPELSEGAALWLTKRKISFLGVEQPSVHQDRHVEVHKLLLSNKVVLVETIANMDKLTQDRVYIAALPLKLAGLDGSPIRLVAMEGISVAE